MTEEKEHGTIPQIKVGDTVWPLFGNSLVIVAESKSHWHLCADAQHYERAKSWDEWRRNWWMKNHIRKFPKKGFPGDDYYSDEASAKEGQWVRANADKIAQIVRVMGYAHYIDPKTITKMRQIAKIIGYEEGGLV